jgi:hypothetical protein
LRLSPLLRLTPTPIVFGSEYRAAATAPAQAPIFHLPPAAHPRLYRPHRRCLPPTPPRPRRPRVPGLPVHPPAAQRSNQNCPTNGTEGAPSASSEQRRHNHSHSHSHPRPEATRAGTLVFSEPVYRYLNRASPFTTKACVAGDNSGPHTKADTEPPILVFRSRSTSALGCRRPPSECPRRGKCQEHPAEGQAPVAQQRVGQAWSSMREGRTGRGALAGGAATGCTSLHECRGAGEGDPPTPLPRAGVKRRSEGKGAGREGRREWVSDPRASDSGRRG